MQLQTIQSKIYEIRGQKVMLDRDLAELYKVETRVLKLTNKSPNTVRTYDVFGLRGVSNRENFMNDNASIYEAFFDQLKKIDETLDFTTQFKFDFQQEDNIRGGLKDKTKPSGN